MAEFTAIPTVPTTDVPDWQSRLLRALIENVEILTGARGGNRAVTTGRISTTPPGNGTFQRVTAAGAGYTIQGVNVPSLEDYTRLLIDVARLGNDVTEMRAAMNSLISQIKGA